jgi:hypothetical protein
VREGRGRGGGGGAVGFLPASTWGRHGIWERVRRLESPPLLGCSRPLPIPSSFRCHPRLDGYRELQAPVVALERRRAPSPSRSSSLGPPPRWLRRGQAAARGGQAAPPPRGCRGAGTRTTAGRAFLCGACSALFPAPPARDPARSSSRRKEAPALRVATTGLGASIDGASLFRTFSIFFPYLAHRSLLLEPTQPNTAGLLI